MHPSGTEIEGEIRNITEFGLFIGLPGEIDGMVHMSDLSWDKPGEEAIKDFKKGDRLKVKVLDIDVEKERVSLGVKQLGGDPFSAAVADIKKGDVITVTVRLIQDNGIEVEIAGGNATGFIRKADLSRERSEQRTERFAVGERIDARVTSIEYAQRRLGLSIKAREIEEDKRAMAEYGSADSGARLGDILGAAISRAQKEKKDKPSGEDGDE